MGLFSKLAKAKRQGIPGRDSGGGMGSAMARPAPPRPTLIQGGPAYFTPEGYTPPIQPEQAFMPTDVMRDPIRDMFAAQPPQVRGPSLPKMPPPDIPPRPPIMCFVAGTKIDMADGTKKVIENIMVGDEVMALNNTTDKVSYVHDIPEDDRQLWTINDRITATDAHAFLTEDGWKSNNPDSSNLVYGDYNIKVSKLNTGDKLITNEGVEEVTDLKNEEAFTKVYNFSTDATHTYMVDGVVSHNKMPPRPPLREIDPIVEEPPMDMPMNDMMIDLPIDMPIDRSIDRPMISGLEDRNLFDFDFSDIDMDAINQRIADAGGTIPQEPMPPMAPPMAPPMMPPINIDRPIIRGLEDRDIMNDFMSIERIAEPRDEFIPPMINEERVPSFIPPIEMPRDMPPMMPKLPEIIPEQMPMPMPMQPRMPMPGPIATPRLELPQTNRIDRQIPMMPRMGVRGRR